MNFESNLSWAWRSGLLFSICCRERYNFALSASSCKKFKLKFINLSETGGWSGRVVWENCQMLFLSSLPLALTIRSMNQIQPCPVTKQLQGSYYVHVWNNTNKKEQQCFPYVYTLIFVLHVSTRHFKTRPANLHNFTQGICLCHQCAPQSYVHTLIMQWSHWNACLQAFNGFGKTKIWLSKVIVTKQWLFG